MIADGDSVFFNFWRGIFVPTQIGPDYGSGNLLSEGWICHYRAVSPGPQMVRRIFRFLAREFCTNADWAGWDIATYFPFGPSQAVQNSPLKIRKI